MKSIFCGLVGLFFFNPILSFGFNQSANVSNDIIYLEEEIKNYIQGEKEITILITQNKLEENFKNKPPTKGGTQGCKKPAKISAENLTTEQVEKLCEKNRDAIGVIEGR